MKKLKEAFGLLLGLLLSAIPLSIFCIMYSAVSSLLLTIGLALLITIIIIKVAEIKLGYLLIFISLAFGGISECLPQSIDIEPIIGGSWCIFLLGIYSLSQNGTKRSADR